MSQIINLTYGEFIEKLGICKPPSFFITIYNFVFIVNDGYEKIYYITKKDDYQYSDISKLYPITCDTNDFLLQIKPIIRSEKYLN